MLFTIECSADILARQQTDGCAILAADSTTTCSHPTATAVRCRGLGTTPNCWLQYYTAGISFLLWWNYYVDERLSWRWRQCISLICWYHFLHSCVVINQKIICKESYLLLKSEIKKEGFVPYNLIITSEFQMSSFKLLVWDTTPYAEDPMFSPLIESLWLSVWVICQWNLLPPQNVSQST